MNVRQCASDFTGILVLNTVNLQVSTCLMGSNVAEPLRPRFLLSVPTLKSAELREGGLVNVGIQICPIAPLHPHTYLLLQLPVVPSEVQLVFRLWIRVGDLLQQAKV